MASTMTNGAASKAIGAAVEAQNAMAAAVLRAKRLASAARAQGLRAEAGRTAAAKLTVKGWR